MLKDNTANMHYFKTNNSRSNNYTCIYYVHQGFTTIFSQNINYMLWQAVNNINSCFMDPYGTYKHIGYVWPPLNIILCSHS